MRRAPRNSADQDLRQPSPGLHVGHDDTVARDETANDLDLLRSPQPEANRLADGAVAVDHVDLPSATLLDGGPATDLQYIRLALDHHVGVDAKVCVQVRCRGIVELDEQHQP